MATDFNADAFLDARSYPSLEALADAVMEIDSDKARWESMVTAPVFRDGPAPALRPEAVADFFERTI